MTQDRENATTTDQADCLDCGRPRSLNADGRCVTCAQEIADRPCPICQSVGEPGACAVCGNCCMGMCPKCFEESGLGCPHGELCGPENCGHQAEQVR